MSALPDYDAMSDDTFRSDVRGFFESEYPEELRFILRRTRWPEMKQWWGRLYAKGWVAPNWPREWGGMGLAASKMLIYLDEMERHGVARTPDQGITHIGPILMRYGTDAQKRHYLPRTLSGEYIWCQGYSEPNAGSDLASLQTSAVLEGDQFVINGQKIWTSIADCATHTYVVVRTDKEARKKQLGISLIIIDLKTPGITIRPIRNIAGDASFCHVYYDDVRVPRENLVGNLNEGWTVAKALLAFEHLVIGSPRRPQYALHRVEAIARARGLFSDSGFMDRYVALKLDIEDLSSLYGRFVEQIKRGDALAPDVSMLKIWTMDTWQRLAELLVEIGAEEGVMNGARNVAGAEADFLGCFYYSRPGTIYGGSNEIQRNIMSRYVLKLPL